MNRVSVAGTSVFYCDNSPVTIAVANYTSNNFFRVTPYYVDDYPGREVCDNNLNQIWIAKLLWQRDVDAPYNANPGYLDLFRYFPHPLALFCPDDPCQTYETSYGGDIEPVYFPPMCDISFVWHCHYLEVPE
jgi:hypothetical protein